MPTRRDVFRLAAGLAAAAIVPARWTRTPGPAAGTLVCAVHPTVAGYDRMARRLVVLKNAPVAGKPRPSSPAPPAAILADSAPIS